MRSVVLVLLIAGCADPIPHAVVHARAADLGLGRAVLVMPTRCVTDLGAYICEPKSYENPDLGVPGAVQYEAFSQLIDPVLRIKLEFAGYTLAEAAAMRVTSGDRTETKTTTTIDPAHGRADTQSSTGTQLTDGTPLLALTEPEIGAVARSLQLAGVITSTLHITPAPYGSKHFELTVTLYPLDAQQPAWTVTCAENFLGNAATSRRLGNCVGNGVLAAFSPDNLMEKPL